MRRVVTVEALMWMLRVRVLMHRMIHHVSLPSNTILIFQIHGMTYSMWVTPKWRINHVGLHTEKVRVVLLVVIVWGLWKRAVELTTVIWGYFWRAASHATIPAWGITLFPITIIITKTRPPRWRWRVCIRTKLWCILIDRALIYTFTLVTPRCTVLRSWDKWVYF